MPFPKIEEARKLNDEELAEEILAAKRKLFDLRLQQATHRLEKPHEFKHTRHRLAQLLTAERERQLTRDREQQLAKEKQEDEIIKSSGNISFPNRIYTGKTYQLEVSLELPQPELTKIEQEDYLHNIKNTAIDAFILVSPRYFEPPRPEVHLIQLNTGTAQFELTPKLEGEAIIGIEFFQSGRHLGGEEIKRKIHA